MSSLDSTSPSLFSPASPDVKIRGKATRKFKKERIRDAANLFDSVEEGREMVEVGEKEDDDSLSFKHGKDNTFDRLCAGNKGKNSDGNPRSVFGFGRGRVRSPFSPVDDNSPVAARVFSSSGECSGAMPTSFASVSSSDASGGGLFATPKEKEDSCDDDKPLRVKKHAAKTVPKRRVTKRQTDLEKDIAIVFSDSMLEYCKRPVQSRETSSASDASENVSKVGGANDRGAEEDGNKVYDGGEEAINVQPRVSLLQLDCSPSAVPGFPARLITSTPIGDSEAGAKKKGWNSNCITMI